MRGKSAGLVSLLVALLLLGVAPAEAGSENQGKQGFRVLDEYGRVVLEAGPEDDELWYVTHYTRLAPDHLQAKPEGKGGGKGGGKDDSTPDPGTDCESDKYGLTGHQWLRPFSAYASQHASLFDQAGQEWDAATGADLFAGVTAGSMGIAGELDDVNQIDFVDLGSTSTVAVTTTWFYRGSGQAVESDAQYNTAYAWATDGSSNAMDVLHVGTHELGHTFGLDHPKGPARANSCLTMYAYVNFGETHGRTLGDGDILGLQDLYGVA